MGALSVVETGLGLLTMLWQAAKGSGVIGSPDWTKYVDAGIYVSQRIASVVASMKSGGTDYDNLTPEQIITLLTPPSFDMVEAEAKARIARGEA